MPAKPSRPDLWLMRHGETAWCSLGAHTGRTDLPLTAAGEAHAAIWGGTWPGGHFALVLTSPLQRARETCRLAGYGDAAQIEPNLSEWDYGAYEGRTSAADPERRARLDHLDVAGSAGRNHRAGGRARQAR